MKPRDSMDRALEAFDAQGAPKQEKVVVEEPLQITIDGHPIAVLMRTPGDDEDLVHGFLITEGILPGLGAIRRLTIEDNQALIFLHDENPIDLAKLSRNLFSASSCGICGKASIDAITSDFPPLVSPKLFAAEAILGAPDRLREGQATFDSTGGLHAAGLFDTKGELLALREDIGRHNAVDKLLGHAVSEGIETASCFLLVSGRVSFEIMQKSLAVRLPLIAAISAPSSLAVDFAKRANQALVAFLRPPRFNLYAGRLSA